MSGHKLLAEEMQHFVVRSGTADLAVSMAGEGPPIVFLHAGVADRRMWWSQLAAFAVTHRVVAFDRRGFGDTQYKAEPHSQVRDLDVVMEALDIQRAVIAGCSQGGGIAIDYALSYPERVDGLVLVAPAINGAPEPASYPIKIQKLVDAIERASQADDIERLNRLEAHAWLDGPGEAEGRVGGNLRLLFLDMNGIALRADDPGEQRDEMNSFKSFRELTVPIEIVSGELDFPHINERSRKLSGQARRAHLSVIRGAAHLPNLERPAEFNALMKRALARMRPA